MSTPGRDRPLLAIVTGHLPPYREHFHRRIAAEMPEIRLATVVTRFRSGPWVNPILPEIGCVSMEPADVAHAGKIAWAINERRKGVAVWRWLEESRPDAILLIGYHELPNLYALAWGRRRGVPVMMWADSNIRSDLATGPKRMAKRWFVPRVCRRLARVLVCGSVGEAFFRRYGVSDDRMTRVPVEPDYALIETMPPERACELAREVGVEPDESRRRIVCCCRLIEQKRVDLVIDAFRTIAAERPEWDLIVVGSGPLRESLERRAGELLPSGRVRFLGFQDQEHVTAIYLTSRALVLASDFEPWALVINEAAAAGMAILATDCVGAAVEMVKDRASGRLVAAGDAPALAEAMRDCTEPERGRAYGERVRQELARWRREADPIAGLRAALRAIGALPPGPG